VNLVDHKIPFIWLQAGREPIPSLLVHENRSDCHVTEVKLVYLDFEKKYKELA
jgi:hypothetical protein